MTTSNLHSRLSLLPAVAQVFSADLDVVRREGKLAVFNAAGLTYECRENDKVGMRLAAALAADLGLAPVTALARAFSVHPEEREKRLTVRFHGLANPRATRALRALCEIVNATTTHYPGTELQLRVEAR